MAGKGWTWTSQRCGRYKYQKVLVHAKALAPRAGNRTSIPARVVP
jgi:hypothetical protein